MHVEISLALTSLNTKHGTRKAKLTSRKWCLPDCSAQYNHNHGLNRFHTNCVLHFLEPNIQPFQNRYPVRNYQDSRFYLVDK